MSPGRASKSTRPWPAPSRRRCWSKALAPEGVTLGEALIGGAGGPLEGANPSRGLLVHGSGQYALD